MFHDVVFPVRPIGVGSEVDDLRRPRVPPIKVLYLTVSRILSSSPLRVAMQLIN